MSNNPVTGHPSFPLRRHFVPVPLRTERDFGRSVKSVHSPVRAFINDGQGGIKEVALLNTIPESMGEGCDKIKYISVAPMFAEAIERIYQEISIAKLFN